MSCASGFRLGIMHAVMDTGSDGVEGCGVGWGYLYVGHVVVIPVVADSVLNPRDATVRQHQQY